MIITLYRQSFIACLIVLSQTPCQASVDTVLVGNLQHRIDVVQSGVTVSTEKKWTTTEAWTAILQSNQINAANVYAGFTTQLYWVGFIAHNESTQEAETVLEIDNPQIDSIAVFKIDSMGNPTLIFETGDRFVFAHRLIQNRSFLFPMRFKPGETRSILIKIDKRNSSLYFPIYLWPEEKLNEANYHANLGFGLCFGFILLCLLYALMAFSFLRKPVYGWYATWIIGTALYSFTALGFSFQYLYPGSASFNSYFRIYLEVGILFSFVKFSQSFLKLRALEPLFHKLANSILWIFVGLISLSGVALGFLERNGVLVTQIVNLLILIGGVIIILAALKTYSRQRSTVLFYFVALGLLLVSYLSINLSEFGFIIFDDLPLNPLLIGSTAEIFIFSIALTYQVSKIYEERNRLTASMTQVQKDLLKAYVEGVEKERERISRELHDDIGSRLGSLKRFLLDKNSTTLEQQIDTLYEDVRTMSRDLSPPSLKLAGLHQKIIELSYEVQQTSTAKVSVQFYDVPENMKQEISHHLYRIVQESINNSIKHAHATEIDLQFFCHQNELVVTIDDNGKGFNTENYSRGIGIKNMKARIESLNGTFEINSAIGQGTSILIRGIFI